MLLPALAEADAGIEHDVAVANAGAAGDVEERSKKRSMSAMMSSEPSIVSRLCMTMTGAP